MSWRISRFKTRKSIARPAIRETIQKLHREWVHLNLSAARGLEEGMEEALTVHKPRAPEQLSRDSCCTHIIEPSFPAVETVSRSLKRWRDGDPIKRWAGSELLVAERPF